MNINYVGKEKKKEYELNDKVEKKRDDSAQTINDGRKRGS